MGDRAAAPWTAADNELLVRAWGAAAIESAPKPATARAVFAHVQRLAGDGDSCRAEKAVQARRSLLLNMHAVIRTHDARAADGAADASATWFQLSEVERRVRFAEINKRGWMQFVNLSAELFADISALKSLSASDGAAESVSEPEASASAGAGGSDDELSARTVRWRAEDTSTLLRAWEQVALESAPRRVTVREIMQRFEQLSEGGSSGRAEVTFVQRHTILRNMHAVIHAHDARVLTDTTGDNDDDFHGSEPRLWFSLSEDDRRRSFAELNTRKWLQYSALTEEQFVAISTIKSLAAAPPMPVVPPAAAEVDRVGEFAMKTHRWRSEDTTLLVRAWAEVALETAKVTAKEVARRFETLSEGGCSGRSITAVPQKHTVIRNMYTIICVHDERAVAEAAASGESVPRLWFDLSKDERRRFFAEMNKKAWTHYVELTEEQFQAISTIKNSRMTEPGALAGAAADDTVADVVDAVEEAVPAALETAPAVKAETRQPTPRAFWSTKNTVLLLRAWAETRVAKSNPHPPLADVVQHFQALAKDSGGQSNESSIRLRHNMLHNMYNIICAYSASLASDPDAESKADERLPWFRLVYDERRRYFTEMNTKASCWFVDLSEDHFQFIADNANKDVSAATEASKDEGDAAAEANLSRRPRGMWTVAHTTTMLRAWREVVSDKSARKPTTGSVYQHFLDLSSGSGGAESSFIHRFRSLRFLHSIIMAYGRTGVDEATGGSNDADGNSSSSKRNGVDTSDKENGVANDEDDVVTAVDIAASTADGHHNDTTSVDNGDTGDDTTHQSSGLDDDGNTIDAADKEEVVSTSAATIDDKVDDEGIDAKPDDNTVDDSSDAREDSTKDTTEANDTDSKESASSDTVAEADAGGSNGVADDANDANALASVTKWFALTTAERRRHFNDAGGKALLFVDITREQFAELASILADKSLPMPMITRRADMRDSGGDGAGKKRVRRQKPPRPEESGEEQASKHRKLLPAPAASASPTGKLGADSEPASDESDAESAGSRQFVARKAADVAHQSSDTQRSEPSPPAGRSRVAYGEGSDGSEVEHHDGLEARSPFRGAVARVADDRSFEQQLKRKRAERLLHDLQAAEASRPPEKRVCAQSRLLAAAALMKKQTRALEKMLRRAKAARARDQAERRSIATSLAADERERRDDAEVARSRLDEIRRQRAAYLDERDALKRALEAEGGAMCE